MEPKTDRARRTVSLPPFAVEVLRRARKEQAERRLLLGAAWVDEDVVADRGDGRPIEPAELPRACHRFAGEGVRLHDLRHAFGTALLETGVHPKVASEALGHSSVAFTMDTYQHVLPTMGEQVAAAIEAALGGA
jgi:integrase